MDFHYATIEIDGEVCLTESSMEAERWRLSGYYEVTYHYQESKEEQDS
ncbi:hypothetical protein KAU11_06810 [Candidatus Babeliales bacterium]|nr:hypothetical protein [Candidatus Babeliales bacterium]